MAKSYRYFTTASVCFSVTADTDEDAEQAAQEYIAGIAEDYTLIDDEHEVRVYLDPSVDGKYPLELSDICDLDDLEEEDDELADGECDQCFRSHVQVARTNDQGETICIDCDEICE